MNAKTKFLKMFQKLPEKSRSKLVFDAYGDKPMSLNVICLEVKYDSLIGKQLLEEMGYEDELGVNK